jgi:hypothetical protein
MQIEGDWGQTPVVFGLATGIVDPDEEGIQVMRVEFQTTEGLAGLPPKLRPVTIDLQQLTDQERKALELLVRQARFFELPARVPTPRGPDGRACRITVKKDDGREHTISVGYCVPGPALQKLIDRLVEIEAAAALRDRRARRRN